jgi:hydroxyacylglutathione hydrolase
MQLYVIPVGPLETNCYIVASDIDAAGKKEAIVIDPGDEAGVILEKVSAENLDVKYVVITHAHWDHIGAAVEVAKITNAKIAAHSMDIPALNRPDKNLADLLGDKLTEHIKADIELEDGMTLRFGNLEAHILHTPGHSRGSISVIIDDSLFTGDLIFYGSIGRTDFEGGSFEALSKSVNDKIFKYPDAVKIYPGHGAATTVGYERRNNPYFSGF